MAENSFGDFFLSDSDDEVTAEDSVGQPVVVVPAPVAPTQAPVASTPTAPDTVSTPEPSAEPLAAAPVPAAAIPAAAPEPLSEPPSAPPVPASVESGQPPGPAVTQGPTREQRLANALNRLMAESPEIQASALVSLDGFTMASALPEGMEEDRVGAMSAAILGLGERAAAELGRGRLSQVFIQGEGGYVLLMAAGSRAALTCIANEDAKLGLVLYDMRSAAETIGEVLG